MAKGTKEPMKNESVSGELVQNANLPSYIKQGENRGSENVSKDDLQIPRIDILQGLSPQINRKKDSYIEGAEIGMMFNTVTGQLYPSEIFFTPITFVKRFLVWVNRKKDPAGGLRGVFDDEAKAEEFLDTHEDAEKLELVPTAEHLVLLDDGTEVILSMAKSKMKVSRKFNSQVRLNGNDRFSRRYRLSVVDDLSAKGEFKNFRISEAGYPTEDVYRNAERIYEEIAQGSRIINTSYEGADGADDADDAGESEGDEY